MIESSSLTERSNRLGTPWQRIKPSATYFERKKDRDELTDMEDIIEEDTTIWTKKL